MTHKKENGCEVIPYKKLGRNYLQGYLMMKRCRTHNVITCRCGKEWKKHHEV